MWFEHGMISTCEGRGTDVSGAERRERAAAAWVWLERRAGAGGRSAASTGSGEDGERWAESGHDGEGGGARRGR